MHLMYYIMCLHNASTFGLATVRFSNLFEVNADVHHPQVVAQ